GDGGGADCQLGCIVDATALHGRIVLDDGVLDRQVQTSIVDTSSSVRGRVVLDLGVADGQSALVVDAAAVGGRATRDGQAYQGSRHTAADLEHSDGVLAADRHEVSAGALDDYWTGCPGQFQRAAQPDRLRRGENRVVEPDDAAGGVGIGIGLGDDVDQVPFGS